MNSGSYATSSKGILEILGVPMAKTGNGYGYGTATEKRKNECA
jgi:hypothetical protein